MFVSISMQIFCQSLTKLQHDLTRFSIVCWSKQQIEIQKIFCNEKKKMALNSTPCLETMSFFKEEFYNPWN